MKQLFLPLLLLLAAPAAATPVLSLNWDGCTGPIDKAQSGAGVYSLYASVTGIPEGQKAYQVWLNYGTTGNTVPDAWRFDAAGCPGSPAALITTTPPATGAACPPLQGAQFGLVLQTIRMHLDTDAEFPVGTMDVILANAYQHDVLTADENTRYFLMRIDFDHSNSVAGAGIPGTSCGGLDQTLYIRAFKKCEYLSLDMADRWFAIPDGGLLATFNGNGGNSPATLTTWGQIRNQYRR